MKRHTRDEVVDLVNRIRSSRTEDEHYELVQVFADDERARVEPFDAIELDVGLFWGDRRKV